MTVHGSWTLDRLVEAYTQPPTTYARAASADVA